MKEQKSKFLKFFLQSRLRETIKISPHPLKTRPRTNHGTSTINSTNPPIYQKIGQPPDSPTPVYSPFHFIQPPISAIADP